MLQQTLKLNILQCFLSLLCDISLYAFHSDVTNNLQMLYMELNT